jgi:dienelactone hydrolase
MGEPAVRTPSSARHPRRPRFLRGSARGVRTRLLSLAVTALLAASAAACGSSSAGGSAANPSTGLAGSGPFAAGTVRYVVAGDPVVVWYPAPKSSVTGRQPYTYHLRSWLPEVIRKLVPASLPDGVTENAYEGVPAAAGSFPVVLFSHGYGGYPEQSTSLTAHLATWGMVVVAPDQLDRDLTAVIGGGGSVATPDDVPEQLAALGYVEALGHTRGSLLAGHVKDAEVASLGHSAGGGTAVQVAAADPAVRGWVALAGVPATPPSTPVPSLMVSGSRDMTVPTSTVRTFYGSLGGPKALVVVDGYGHNVFDDVCTVNHAHGGVVPAVKELHLPVPPGLLRLATDGCSPPDRYPPTAWPLIDQVVTAQLRFDFGQTRTVVGLGPTLTTAFGGVHAQVSTSS